MGLIFKDQLIEFKYVIKIFSVYSISIYLLTFFFFNKMDSFLKCATI